MDTVMKSIQNPDAQQYVMSALGAVGCISTLDVKPH